MFQSWRLKLREVEESLQLGRLDEALQMLSQGGLFEYLPAKRLGEQLSLAFAERARRRALEGDLAGGWRDLDAALSLGVLPASDVARRCLFDATLAEIEALVRGGDLNAAVVQLDQMEKHTATHPRVQTWRQVVRSLQSARNLSRRGKFADAEAHLDIALGLRPELDVVQRQRADCREKQQLSRQLSEELYRTMADANWHEVLRVAEALLAMAPEYKLAREARNKVWRQVGGELGSRVFTSTHVGGRRPEEFLDQGEVMENAAPLSPRFVLWVDGVGGFLVCLGDEIVLGQHVPGNRVEVPILGDLSRQHARIRRSGDGYMIEPLQSIAVNGKAIVRAVTLVDGDELELGSSVKLRFRRPHPLSATARLEPLSPHRTQPLTDGVLLMAESCVLGPKWQNHVVCREWSGDVVLYRHDTELFCRATGPVEIDGQLCEGRTRLGGNSRVVGSDFSMCLEELDR